MTPPTLFVIEVSTREGRAGEPVAEWARACAVSHGKFAAELVDLREVNLPVFDEPHHPRLGKYEHEATKKWSARVKRADAFVFVTPEYNYGMPPSLLNALTYLNAEWAYKAAGFVSYGAGSGGTRGVQMAKMVMTSLKIVPIPEAVSIPFFAKSIVDGVFNGGETQEKAANVMLDELHRWTTALSTLRG
jgi:NAD(P)H-dependent FMN reductase